MATKTHDLAVVVGEYRDNQGQTKRRYQNVGALMQGDNGPFIMLAKWFNPAGVADSRGGESLLLSCFEPRQGQQQSAPARQQPSAPSSNDYDSDIPF